MGTRIQVFEHERLYLGQKGFGEPHFRILQRFHNRSRINYLALGPNWVKFSHYVGVIQIGHTTIEILPKADAGTDPSEKEKKPWHGALVGMLKACRRLKLNHEQDAMLAIRSGSILDLYLLTFLNEVELIQRRGLLKQYRQKGENMRTFKGRIDFKRHLQHNLIHRERVYAVHSVYDRVNPLNGILKAALQVIPQLTAYPPVLIRTQKLKLAFEEIPPFIPRDWSRLKQIGLDRKTSRYGKALDLAYLLLNQLYPDLSHGPEKVLALLFDMNRLFEDYIYRQVGKAAPELGLEVVRKPRKAFWLSDAGNRYLEPDIVVQRDGETLVVDTKWKLPGDRSAGSQDLRQLFAYGEYWKANQSALLYPWVKGCQNIVGKFAGEKGAGKMVFVSLLDDMGKLRGREIGLEVLGTLLEGPTIDRR